MAMGERQHDQFATEVVAGHPAHAIEPRHAGRQVKDLALVLAKAESHPGGCQRMHPELVLHVGGLDVENAEGPAKLLALPSIALLYAADRLPRFRGAPLLILASIPIPMVLLPIIRGVLQGGQRFLALGLNMVIEGGMRFGLGVLVLWVGWQSSGGLGATTGAGLIAIAAGWYVVLILLAIAVLGLGMSHPRPHE